MSQKIQLMPRTFVVHPYFIEPILTRKKVTILTQDDIQEGTPMIIEAAIPGPDGKIKQEVQFATATVAKVQALRLDPATETIEMAARMSNQWLKLSKEGVANLIKYEGFNHKDDFWKNIQQQKRYEAIHITFENLQISTKYLN